MCNFFRCDEHININIDAFAVAVSDASLNSYSLLDNYVQYFNLYNISRHFRVAHILAVLLTALLLISKLGFLKQQCANSFPEQCTFGAGYSCE